MSRFWLWLLTHLSILWQKPDKQEMEVRFQSRQRTQEEQLDDARRRVEFLQNQTILRGKKLE